MYYSRKYNIRPGDRIISPIFKTGITKHHAIFLGTLSDGQEWVSENHHTAGIRMVEAYKFFVPSKEYRVQKFEGNEIQRSAAVHAAISQLGQPYNLVNNNCEHFASFVQTGIAESKQVMQVVGIALLLLIIGLFNTK